jgi:hypothetical protein
MAILIAFLVQVKEGEAEITDFCSRFTRHYSGGRFSVFFYLSQSSQRHAELCGCFSSPQRHRVHRVCILFLPDRETPIGQKATALRAGPVKVPVVLFLLSKPGR